MAIVFPPSMLLGDFDFESIHHNILSIICVTLSVSDSVQCILMCIKPLALVDVKLSFVDTSRVQFMSICKIAPR